VSSWVHDKKENMDRELKVVEKDIAKIYEKNDLGIF
jgi:hypothetical protein